MYQFYLPIGDWSDDGHGKCVNFLIGSNFPVERVREAHYRIEDVTGVDIEEICGDYEENTVEPKIAERLASIKKLRDMGFTGFEPGEPVSVDDMAKLWLSLLHLADPELKLDFVEGPIPMLPFYGNDERGRHIGQVGYGLF